MKKVITILAIAAFALYLPACNGKVKDADVKTAVDAALASNPDYNGVVADVKEGVAILTGEVRDLAVQSALQTTVAGIKGVKSVQNNTMIAPPPTVTPPVIASDDAITKGITDVLKDHPGVKATVTDGVIYVTGETTAANWQRIKMSLDALRPKRVDASGLKIR